MEMHGRNEILDKAGPSFPILETLMLCLKGSLDESDGKLPPMKELQISSYKWKDHDPLSIETFWDFSSLVSLYLRKVDIVEVFNALPISTIMNLKILALNPSENYNAEWNFDWGNGGEDIAEPGVDVIQCIRNRAANIIDDYREQVLTSYNFEPLAQKFRHLQNLQILHVRDPQWQQLLPLDFIRIGGPNLKELSIISHGDDWGQEHPWHKGEQQMPVKTLKKILSYWPELNHLAVCIDMQSPKVNIITFLHVMSKLIYTRFSNLSKLSRALKGFGQFISAPKAI